jgi:hypothetical protein
MQGDQMDRPGLTKKLERTWGEQIGVAGEDLHFRHILRQGRLDDGRAFKAETPWST